MIHEKIFKRPDGKRVKIIASFSDGGYSSTPKWSFFIHVCDPKKRTWYSVADSNDYEWRKLNHEQREAHNIRQYLEHVTPEEVLETKLELWNKIKPE